MPHLGATHLPWKRRRNCYNSLISSKYTSHFLQQLWHLFLLLHLIQAMSHGHWRSQGGTLALQPPHAVHRPSHQAGTNPCCPPMAADLMSPLWLGRVRDHQINGLQHTTCFFLPQKDAQTALWMSTSLRWLCRNNTPLSQGRSRPSPWGDHHPSHFLP